LIGEITTQSSADTLSLLDASDAAISGELLKIDGGDFKINLSKLL
jgi:hypothetical protein